MKTQYKCSKCNNCTEYKVQKTFFIDQVLVESKVKLVKVREVNAICDCCGTTMADLYEIASREKLGKQVRNWRLSLCD